MPTPPLCLLAAVLLLLAPAGAQETCSGAAPAPPGAPPLPPAREEGLLALAEKREESQGLVLAVVMARRLHVVGRARRGRRLHARRHLRVRLGVPVRRRGLLLLLPLQFFRGRSAGSALGLGQRGYK